MEDYRYFAFVSYSSRDVAWGSRVQRRLEHYRIPSDAGCDWSDKRMRPVFFAPTDIQPGALTPELMRRLEQSRHLVVIGSPSSAASEWVGREIEYFHSLGRADRIHYFIVSSGDPKAAYHPVLERLGMPELLGANVHERIYRWPWMNRERAYVQLISKLLGVEFDSVWQRHRRQLVRQAVVALVVVLAVVSALVTVWLKGRPFDAAVELQEATAPNGDLPQMRDAVVTLTLDNETKRVRAESFGQAATVRNIPHGYLGRRVRLTVRAEGWLPVDTVVELSRRQTVALSRDPRPYGDVRFSLWDPRRELTVVAPALVDGMPARADAEGRLTLEVPLQRQRQFYVVQTTLPLECDTIYMPRGENDVLVISK